MLIYDKAALRNLSILRQAARWQDSGVISAQQLARIQEAYACDLYTPGVFVQLTLFLATTLAVAAGWGLMAMFAFDFQEFGLAILMLSYSAGIYQFLGSIVTKQKRFFHAGVDDALILLSCGFAVAGVLLLVHMAAGDLPPQLTMLVSLPFLAWFAVRFASPVMAVAAWACCFGFVFYQMLEFGIWGKALLPFVVMMVSAPGIALSHKKLEHAPCEPWWPSLKSIKILGLITFYTAGNYFVVRQLSTSLLELEIAAGDDIPLAFVFYVLTAIVPLVYLGWGFVARDMVFVRTGMLAAALSILTLKYYVSVAPPEITLTIAGLILIATAIGAMKYFQHPVNGYTRKSLLKRSAESLDVEALLVAETMSSTARRQTSDASVKPGGGSSGGAGAEGSY